MQSKEVKSLLYKMLIENTGIHMMDSGGDNNRAWQRNQAKTLQDFQKEPTISYEIDGDTSEAIDLTVSVFHYLDRILEIDDACEAFNAKPVNNWNSETYGLSKEGEQWLKRNHFVIGQSFNTYNGESLLSQVLQYTLVSKEMGDGEILSYVLLQVHGGADVRGGYTDAKLFKFINSDNYIDGVPNIEGTINGIEVMNDYGLYLKNSDDQFVPLKNDGTDVINIDLTI